MHYSEVKANDVPIVLLLEADPSEHIIRSYLDDSWCFVATLDGQVVGACIAKTIGTGIAEIFNISVYPEFQKRGIGSGLLRFSLQALADKKIKRVELSTGTFGYQLAYYQRAGFRVETVVKDYFLKTYPEPIIENGIQLKDMLRLYISLEPCP